MRKTTIISIFFLLFNSILSASLPDSVNKNDEHKIKSLTGGHTYGINFIIQLKNGLLASAGKDGRIVIRNIETGEIVRTLTGHKGAIDEIRQLSDGTLVSASRDSTVRFWNIDTGVNFKTLENNLHHPYYGPQYFSTIAELSGNRLALGDSFTTLSIWDINTLRLQSESRLSYRNYVLYRFKLISDETLGVCHGSGQVSLHRTSDTTLQWLNGFEGYDMGTATDIEELDDEYLAIGSTDRTINVWSKKTGAIKSWIGAGSIIYQLKKLSKNIIASAQHDKTVKIWDLDTGRLVNVLEGHNEKVTSLELLKDGNLASASDDMQIIIWNTKEILNL